MSDFESELTAEEAEVDAQAATDLLVEDEEEVLFNGELYSWIESLQQWRLQER